MKKTLLATAIAGALGVSAAAQAATVYEQDGTKIDVYGRINFAITGGGVQPEDEALKQTGSEFRDVFSRFGFRASHELNSDLTAFGNIELRPRMDAVNNGDITVRNSFVGLRSDQFGTVRVGNFDSVFYQAVSSVFDVPEFEGFTAVDTGSTAGRGDSIQYSTPVLEGFQAHVSVKHLSGNGAEVGAQDNSSSTTWQTAISYTWQDLYLAAAYNQSKQPEEDRGYGYDGGGPSASGEDLWGVVAAYNFTPAFSGRLTYQAVDDVNEQAELTAGTEIENLWGLGATFDYGLGEIYGDYYRVRMAREGVDSQNRWVVGANYRFSEPMYVYAEVADFDFSSDDSLNQLDDDVIYAVGLRYDF